MKKLILICLLSLFTISLDAQVTQEWAARYNGSVNASDYGSIVVTDAAGNVYVTGVSPNSTAVSMGDFITIKYNSAGAELWTARYNGPGNGHDVATSLAVDALGNVYVTGWSMGSATNYDYATIKYNSSGIQQWVERFNGPGNGADYASSIAVDNSGNVYVTGYSTGAGTNYDCCTIKYDSAGNTVWNSRYNGTSNNVDEANDLSIDNSGNVYVTGYSKSTSTYEDYITIKYNSAGVQQWAKSYNGTGNAYDFANAMTVDLSGNIYVTGLSNGTGSGFDCVTIKYDTSGNEVWVSRYNDLYNGIDAGESITLDNSGNIYVAGIGVQTDTTNDYLLIKYNPAGTQQWVRNYNGSPRGNDDAKSVKTDALGNVYITGVSTGMGTNSDMATLKYSPAGVQQWVMRYNGSANNLDYGSWIDVDILGNVYVTGSSTETGTNGDVRTIKYSQSVGIQQVSTEIPEKYSLSQNYPNPFNPSTEIEFKIPFGGSRQQAVSLKVYNSLGKEVSELVNQNLQPGVYKYSFDGSGLTSGIYFYTLNTGTYKETKKMLMIK